MHLLYIADPLCSWCYGFGPELSKLLASHTDTRLDLVMGGLRPFNREAMSDAFRNMLREHWHHVAEASGLPFSEAILARELPADRAWMALKNDRNVALRMAGF